MISPGSMSSDDDASLPQPPQPSSMASAMIPHTSDRFRTCAS
jgi:hypothetical protein